MPSGKAKENGSIQRSCNDTSKCIEFVASYRAYGADQRTNFCHKDEPRRYDTTTYFHLRLQDGENKKCLERGKLLNSIK